MDQKPTHHYTSHDPILAYLIEEKKEEPRVSLSVLC